MRHIFYDSLKKILFAFVAMLFVAPAFSATLPAGYTQLEYIEGTGTQYITTNVIANRGTSAEIKFVANSLEGYGAIFGARKSKTEQAFNAWLHFSNGMMGINYSYLGQFDGALIAQTNTIYTMSITPNKLTINNTETTISGATDFTTPGGLWLFNTNGANATSSGTGNRIFVGKIYYFKVWQNNNLVLDMVPAKYVSGNTTTYGMYDLADSNPATAFHTNQGTGTFTPGPTACPGGTLENRHESGLPVGYTLLDYIQSSGTQWIDTGLKANLETKAEIEYKLTEYSSEHIGGLFGDRSGQNANAFLVGTSDGTSTATTSKMFGQFDNVTGTNSNLISIDLNKHTIELSKSGFFLDGTLRRSYPNPTSFETSHTIPLFAAYSSGSSTNEFKEGIYAIYRFKMWQDGTLVRDMVPAKNSSNVIGMYDLVSVQFFTNQGTGTFTAGNTVSDPIVEQCVAGGGIKIATTKYTEDAFAGLITTLSEAITKVTNIVDTTVQQATEIGNLATTKQDRPDTDCPAGRKCLLIMGADNKPHWYLIQE